MDYDGQAAFKSAFQRLRDKVDDLNTPPYVLQPLYINYTIQSTIYIMQLEKKVRDLEAELTTRNQQLF